MTSRPMRPLRTPGMVARKTLPAGKGADADSLTSRLASRRPLRSPRGGCPEDPHPRIESGAGSNPLLCRLGRLRPKSVSGLPSNQPQPIPTVPSLLPLTFVRSLLSFG